MLEAIKCFFNGHTMVLAVSDSDGEVDLPNGETVFGVLELYACIKCGKVISKFTPESEVPEDDYWKYNL